MTVPDARDFQQLHPIGAHGAVNCTAESAAWVAAAAGFLGITGEEVRAASDEPIPDPDSPGLNLHQVDESLLTLTKGKMNLAVHTGYSIVEAQKRIIDGEWAIVQVNRSVLVAAGFGGPSKFGGGHAITIHYVNGSPVDGDPLIPVYERIGWPSLWRAAGSLALSAHTTVGQGKANVAFTRDLTADYTARVDPAPGQKIKGFYAYTLTPDGKRIASRTPKQTRGMGGDCTPPRFYPWPGHEGRDLVQITTGGHRGWWVNARFATKTEGSQP